MNKTIQLAVVCVAVLAASSGQVQAAIITNVVNNFDLNTMNAIPMSHGNRLVTAYPLGGVAVTPFQAQVGDILNTTINFLPGQSLTLNDGPVQPWADGSESVRVLFIDSNSPTTTTYSETTSVTFINPSGELNLSPNGSGSTSIGGGTFGNITNSSFTFTGFSTISTVTAQSAPSKMYDSAYLWSALSSNTVINESQVVPEPSSLALLGIGACVSGLGAARRRRREKKQATA